MTTALDLGGSSASTWPVQRKCELEPELLPHTGEFNSEGRQEREGEEEEDKEEGKGSKKKKSGGGVENKGHHFDSSSLKGPSSPFTGAQ